MWVFNIKNESNENNHLSDRVSYMEKRPKDPNLWEEFAVQVNILDIIAGRVGPSARDTNANL